MELLVLGGRGEMVLCVGKEKKCFKGERTLGLKTGVLQGLLCLNACANHPTSHVEGCSRTIGAHLKLQGALNPYIYVFPQT